MEDYIDKMEQQQLSQKMTKDCYYPRILNPFAGKMTNQRMMKAGMPGGKELLDTCLGLNQQRHLYKI